MRTSRILPAAALLVGAFVAATGLAGADDHQDPRPGSMARMHADMVSSSPEMARMHGEMVSGRSSMDGHMDRMTSMDGHMGMMGGSGTGS